MADRRSAGAESLAVFEQTLDRLLATSGYDRDVQDRVLDAIRTGASTMHSIAEATGLPLPTVRRAIAVLAAGGRVDTQPAASPARRMPRRPRTPAPAPDPGNRVAKTG